LRRAVVRERFGLGFRLAYATPELRLADQPMFYVYVIRSVSDAKRYYIGFTENIDQRIKEHNEGKSFHTAKYGPWQLAINLAVPSKTKALDLEHYLKSGSGRAFLQRHIL
jgi:putative endonuclease